jgi:phosphate-selective porin OprO and OprP
MGNFVVGFFVIGGWHVNSNVRFMFDWIHGSVAKATASPANADIGAHYNVFAMRTQVAL